jgi:hypothetical protein
MLGFLGLALHQRGVEAEPRAIADRGLSEPEANMNDVEVYNRTAKEKRSDRWAERLADEEAIDAKPKNPGLKMTVLIYVDTSKQVGDPDHLKVFANADAAETWFEQNGSEGVAFGPW